MDTMRYYLSKIAYIAALVYFKSDPQCYTLKFYNPNLEHDIEACYNYGRET